MCFHFLGHQNSILEPQGRPCGPKGTSTSLLHGAAPWAVPSPPAAQVQSQAAVDPPCPDHVPGGASHTPHCSGYRQPWVAAIMVSSSDATHEVTQVGRGRARTETQVCLTPKALQCLHSAQPGTSPWISRPLLTGTESGDSNCPGDGRGLEGWVFSKAERLPLLENMLQPGTQALLWVPPDGPWPEQRGQENHRGLVPCP